MQSYIQGILLFFTVIFVGSVLAYFLFKSAEEGE